MCLFRIVSSSLFPSLSQQHQQKRQGPEILGAELLPRDVVMKSCKAASGSASSRSRPAPAAAPAAVPAEPAAEPGDSDGDEEDDEEYQLPAHLAEIKAVVRRKSISSPCNISFRKRRI